MSLPPTTKWLHFVRWSAAARLICIVLLLAILVPLPKANAQAEPLIATQPTTRSVNFGQSATFVVVATGEPAPEYQWRFHEDALAHATNATLTLPATHLTNAGNYRVVVSNLAGVVTSDVATLTVITQPPVITTQPTNRVATAGQFVTFTARASGIPVPAFRWFSNDVLIASPAISNLTVRNVQASNSGSYFVVVSNIAGAVTSAVVSLVVTPAPTDSGKPDLDFYAGTGPFGPVNALAIQPDGRILIGGTFSLIDGFPQRYLGRLHPNGSVDTNFLLVLMELARSSTPSPCKTTVH